MEFVPICLECENFENGGKCSFFGEAPQAIKNREIRCEHYHGDDVNYVLYTRDSKPMTGTIKGGRRHDQLQSSPIALHG